MFSWEIKFKTSITFLTTLLKLEFYSYKKQMVQICKKCNCEHNNYFKVRYLNRLFLCTCFNMIKSTNTVSKYSILHMKCGCLKVNSVAEESVFWILLGPFSYSDFSPLLHHHKFIDLLVVASLL